MGQGNRLAAVLVGGHLRHDLRGDVAGGGKAVGPLNECAGDDGAVLQHILQIHKVAVVHVLGEVIRVMEVDDTLPVSIHDLLRQQDALCDVPADLTGHIVPLGGVHHRVLVGVFLLGLLVAALDEAEDLLVGGVGAADQRAGVAVGHIVLGHLKGTVGHDLILHQILYFLHGGGTVHFQAGKLHAFRNALNLHRGHPNGLVHAFIGLCDGRNDLRNVKGHLRTVPFNNFHGHSPPYYCAET